MNSPNSSGAKSSAAFFLSVLTLSLAFVASFLCATELMFQAMMGLSRYPSEDGPLQVYLHLVEVDRRRAPERRMSAATVRAVPAVNTTVSGRMLPIVRSAEPATLRTTVAITSAVSSER